MTELDEIRQAVRRLCIDFPETYWVELANSAAPFPTATDPFPNNYHNAWPPSSRITR